jgi:hypothetical protein
MASQACWWWTPHRTRHNNSAKSCTGWQENTDGSSALLPLPALLSSAVIGLIAMAQLLRATPLGVGHDVEVE